MMPNEEKFIRILLEMVCNDTNSMAIIEGNLPKKPKSSLIKNINLLKVYFKSSMIDALINLFKVHQEIGEVFLKSVVKCYLNGEEICEIDKKELEENPGIKRCLGYLAHYILNNDVEKCKNLLRYIDEIIENNKKIEQINALESLKRNKINLQKKIDELENEIDKYKQKSTEIEKIYSELYKTFNDLAKEKLELENRTIKLEADYNATLLDLEKSKADLKGLRDENLMLKSEKNNLLEEVNILAERLQYEEYNKSVPENIILFGANRFLPNNEKYNIRLAEIHECVNIEEQLKTGQEVWVVLVNLPLKLKRLVKKLNVYECLKIFNTSKELVEFLSVK